MDHAQGAQAKGMAYYFKHHLREYGLLIALIAIMLFFQVVTDGTLLKSVNITNLFLQNSYIIIMALGMLVVIVSGNIDLSVGSVMGFIGAFAAVMIVELGQPVWITIIASLGMGVVIGAAQGYFVAYWKIPSFIVTLAGMLVFRGASLWLLEGQSVGPFPREFQSLSTGFVGDILPKAATSGLAELAGSRNFNALAMGLGIIAVAVIVYMGLRDRARNAQYGIEGEPKSFFIVRNVVIALALLFVSFKLATFRGLPNVLISMVVLTVVYAFLTANTTIGRRIYALGGNEKAAKLSGIKTERLTFLAFVNMGLLAALAGLIFAARLNTATPKAGFAVELDVIAAVFIGGASMSGGSGKVIGAVVGAFIMGVMNNGMSIVGIGIDYQQMIKGLVLLAAVFFDVYNRSKQG
ncbi:multiple monosaccharide ABC transporter permease [Tropicibacter naphthalenivorans]|uniref:Xylose transport system permease protein XylH n=1 Tax=Tropicibacter naphthalenivorans TaxID=441103 RepID=A0A0P1GHE3_9RHOB|nr:multiple monosaccharide ABC transporter permease [Tropicibacter naphthalenivorans]CUH81091.1 Xylose transport system permease protein XylH [Tropicibacter naphthalenivorans]SMC97127.1 multiple monosaccharide ABC transporter membrane protein [Tropicibacter naphthalenivorans]